jgi:hypothetical protein
MRKIIKLITMTMLFIFVVSGCGITQDATDDGSTTNNGNDTTSEGEQPRDDTFQAEIIESGSTLLITPDLESNEYRSSDKMSVSLVDTVITDKDGEKIAREDLKAGDIIEITYNGMILESYPAQISASSIKVVDHNLLIDGYLAVMDDLYQEDEALNSEIEMIALDTTEWVDLTDIEKEIIFTKMKETYGMDIIEATYEELAEEGLIDKESLFFPNGIHITISNVKYNANKNKITCSTKKWRSGLGAIGAEDVTAKFDGTEWIITKDGMWIS